MGVKDKGNKPVYLFNRREQKHERFKQCRKLSLLYIVLLDIFHVVNHFI